MRLRLSLSEQLKIDPSAIRKILIIRLRRMGDILMTTPAVRAVRDRFPKAHLVYVVEEPFRQLMEGSSAVDEVLVLPRHPDFKTFSRLVKNIRRNRFDAVLDFHGGPRAFQMALLSGAAIKIGYKVKYKGWLYSQSIPRNPLDGSTHSVVNHMKLAEALGARADPGRLEMVHSSEEEAGSVGSRLDTCGFKKGGFIVFHISAGNRFREWGAEKIRTFVQLLEQKTGMGVVLAGASEDRNSAEFIQQGNPGVCSLVGEINLRQLFWLISQARLFVGPDSGPMHMAAVTSTPIVALFGPTLPDNFSPWKAHAKLIQKNLSCRPCRQRECIHKDFRCLQTITPEEVLEACLAYLKD
jgi:ADP-heptose:LPS heptosyltransferase